MRIRIWLIPLILLVFWGCSETSRSQSDGQNCLIYGQINYSMAGYVEEGLRELVLMNLSTNTEYPTVVLPYEKGFLLMNVPQGQYAVKSAKWVFLDTKVLSRSGVYRQLTVELKFTSDSYGYTVFNVQKPGVFFAGSYLVEVKQEYSVKKVYNEKFIPLIEKIKEKISNTNWIESFKSELKKLPEQQRVFFESYLRKKIPGESALQYNNLVDNYFNNY